jgi:trehalose 2-sulfotransferase
LARAHLTGVWYRLAESEPGPDPEYGYDLIDGLVRLVDEHNSAWQRWFDDHDIEPYTVTYEDLDADPTGVTRRVLTFLDVDLASVQPITAQTTRQATALNTIWIARYKAERRSRQPAD